MQDSDQDQGNSTDEASDPAGLRHRAEEAQSKTKEAETRAVAAERRAAFAEAGIPSEGVGALFRKAYDGDVTLEAIQASASEYGISGQSAANTSPAPSDGELQAMSTVASGLASNEAPAQQSSESALNLEIVKIARTGDQFALMDYLENQGLLMDPDASEGPARLLNQTPRMSGVTGANPAGVNSQVI